MTAAIERDGTGPSTGVLSPRARRWNGWLLTSLVLALLLLIAVASAAGADPGPAVPSSAGESRSLTPTDHREGAAEASVPVATVLSTLLPALGLGGVVASARRGRRAAVVMLTILLVCFAVETGAHSVHHFADPEKASRCAASWASQHVEGTHGDPPDVRLPAMPLGAPAPASAGGQQPVSTVALPEGRAPPRLFTA
jgi:hypothetical protein